MDESFSSVPAPKFCHSVTDTKNGL